MALTFDQVRDAANGRWKELIFPAFRIVVPAHKSAHGPCPICGGKDRFRCDDLQGKGTWFCNVCRAGDGFSLIEKARDMPYSMVLTEVGAVVGLSAETKVTDADRKKWKEKAEAQAIAAELDERKSQEVAAKRAVRIMAYKSADRDCPYLERKQVQNYGCRINGKGNLIVPLFDKDGKIWNVQEIHADGHKPFLPGGRVSACFFIIGEIVSSDQLIGFAEGYATGASIHEATGYVVVVVFNSGNMDKVAKEIRVLHPSAPFVFFADDDSHSTPPDAGLKAANKAVAATGGIVILPEFSQAVNV